MNKLTLIFALSTIIWYIVDRVKPVWAKLKYSKYITIGLAAVLSCIVTIVYNLDIIYGFELVESPNIVGNILTALLMMSSSSAIAEVINKIKKT